MNANFQTTGLDLSGLECNVCLEPIGDKPYACHVVDPKVVHPFCLDCIQQSVAHLNHLCPTCRAPLSQRDIQRFCPVAAPPNGFYAQEWVINALEHNDTENYVAPAPLPIPIYLKVPAIFARFLGTPLGVTSTCVYYFSSIASIVIYHAILPLIIAVGSPVLIEIITIVFLIVNFSLLCFFLYSCLFIEEINQLL